ncbi:hypothetical protein CXG81DRAFT_19671 [Caulochytrium protostelioides]|uniref:BRCT domain-containing protein n=1 Tax=Caulochytrium protostelioides TaxID=1555241 RepID=A0A4P9X5G5_9FUNG|nr:hypothetical protein CXG81DRAFT_19671 [Caulochytrium protostelioides]|eukprot:RKP00367.1 hypothetical protein CXG81DRAFT_19671 [Caulochytrium protostelioides]
MPTARPPGLSLEDNARAFTSQVSLIPRSILRSAFFVTRADPHSVILKLPMTHPEAATAAAAAAAAATATATAEAATTATATTQDGTPSPHHDGEHAASMPPMPDAGPIMTRADPSVAPACSSGDDNADADHTEDPATTQNSLRLRGWIYVHPSAEAMVPADALTATGLDAISRDQLAALLASTASFVAQSPLYLVATTVLFTDAVARRAAAVAGVHVVHPTWLLRSVALGERQPPDRFGLGAAQWLAGVTLAVVHLPWTVRMHVYATAAAFGAQFRKTPDALCTHVLGLYAPGDEPDDLGGGFSHRGHGNSSNDSSNGNSNGNDGAAATTESMPLADLVAETACAVAATRPSSTAATPEVHGAWFVSADWLQACVRLKTRAPEMPFVLAPVPPSPSVPAPGMAWQSGMTRFDGLVQRARRQRQREWKRHVLAHPPLTDVRSAGAVATPADPLHPADLALDPAPAAGPPPADADEMPLPGTQDIESATAASNSHSDDDMHDVHGEMAGVSSRQPSICAAWYGRTFYLSCLCCLPAQSQDKAVVAERNRWVDLKAALKQAGAHYVADPSRAACLILHCQKHPLFRRATAPHPDEEASYRGSQAIGNAAWACAMLRDDAVWTWPAAAAEWMPAPVSFPAPLRPRPYHLLFLGLERSLRRRLARLVRWMGATLATEPTADVTHVVSCSDGPCATLSNDPDALEYQRHLWQTLSAATSVRGVHLVSPLWVEASFLAMQWLPEAQPRFTCWELGATVLAAARVWGGWPADLLDVWRREAVTAVAAPVVAGPAGAASPTAKRPRTDDPFAMDAPSSRMMLMPPPLASPSSPSHHHALVPRLVPADADAADGVRGRSASSTAAAAAPPPSRGGSTSRGGFRLLPTGVVLTAQGQSQLTALGATLATSVETCTHIVTDRPTRTEKFLMGLTLGRTMVHIRWIKASFAAGRWLPAAGFPVTDPPFEQTWHYRPEVTALRYRHREAQRQQLLALAGLSGTSLPRGALGLFGGIQFYATPHVQPAREILKRLVLSGGGTWLDHLPTLPAATAPETGREAPLVICIGTVPDIQSIRRANRPHVHFFSSEFILTACLQQQLPWDHPALRLVDAATPAARRAPPSGESNERH